MTIANRKSSFLSRLMLGKCYIQLVIADVSVMQILQTVYTRSRLCKHYIFISVGSFPKKICTVVILTDRCTMSDF